MTDTGINLGTILPETADQYLKELRIFRSWAQGYAAAGGSLPSLYPIEMFEAHLLDGIRKAKEAKPEPTPEREISSLLLSALRNQLQDIAGAFRSVNTVGEVALDIPLVELHNRVQDLLEAVMTADPPTHNARDHAHLPPHPMIEWDAYQCWKALFDQGTTNYSGLDYIRYLMHLARGRHNLSPAGEERVMHMLKALEEVEQRLGNKPHEV